MENREGEYYSRHETSQVMGYIPIGVRVEVTAVFRGNMGSIKVLIQNVSPIVLPGG